MKATLSHQKGAQLNKDITLHVFSFRARGDKPAAP